MTEATDHRQLAEHAPRGGGRAVAAHRQGAATVDTGDAARLHLHHGGGSDVDGALGSSAGQVLGRPLALSHLFARRALLGAPLSAGAVRR